MIQNSGEGVPLTSLLVSYANAREDTLLHTKGCSGQTKVAVTVFGSA